MRQSVGLNVLMLSWSSRNLGCDGAADFLGALSERNAKEVLSNRGMERTTYLFGELEFWKIIQELAKGFVGWLPFLNYNVFKSDLCVSIISASSIIHNE